MKYKVVWENIYKAVCVLDTDSEWEAKNMVYKLSRDGIHSRLYELVDL